MKKSKPRNPLSTRLWHWVNFAALVVLFMSGLNISNAHRYLYWGDYGLDGIDAWTVVMRFPSWATLPQRYDLAAARDWHNLAAWVFALALLMIWIAMLVNGHFKRDIALSRKQWSFAALRQDIAHHLKGKFEAIGEKYNLTQKLAYGLVLGVFLPMMVFTGLAISPGFEPAAPWLVDILGGRQSARSLHFIFAWATFAFFVVHIALVIGTLAWRKTLDMITGGKQQETPDEA